MAGKTYQYLSECPSGMLRDDWLDVEELPVFKELASGWADPLVAADPVFRMQVRAAYSSATEMCLRGRIPVITGHPSSPERVKLLAEKYNREVVLLMMPNDHILSERLRKWVEEDVPGQNDLIQERLEALWRGRDRILELSRELNCEILSDWKSVRAHLGLE